MQCIRLPQASHPRNLTVRNDFHPRPPRGCRIGQDFRPGGETRTILHEATASPRSEMKRTNRPRTQGTYVTPKSIASHLRVDQYGDFWLTDAIRPAPAVPIAPRQGYRIETYRDPKANFQV